MALRDHCASELSKQDEKRMRETRVFQRWEKTDADAGDEKGEIKRLALDDDIRSM